MIQRPNPAINIFLETPIELEGNSSSFICSMNKTLFGVYKIIKRAELTQFKKTVEVIDGEIIIFQLKERSWIEYFRVKIQSNSILELLCFRTHGKQLLFYKSWTNCVESLSLNSIDQLDNQPTSQTVGCYLQFQQDKEKVQMILSNDQKIILIQTEQTYLVFNVISKRIISQLKNELQSMCFFDGFYLIEICHPIKNNGGNLKIYDVQNMKVKKFLKPKRLQSSLIYELNNCKSLAFTSESLIYARNHRVYATIFNMTNIKVVRKVMIKFEFENTSFFLGYNQRYLMHLLQSKSNQVNLCIIDLYNMEISLSIMKQICSFQNQVLKLTDRRLMYNEYWLTK